MTDAPKTKSSMPEPPQMKADQTFVSPFSLAHGLEPEWGRQIRKVQFQTDYLRRQLQSLPLPGRDRTIAEMVAKHVFITSDQLAGFFGVSSSVIKRRLERLAYNRTCPILVSVRWSQGGRDTKVFGLDQGGLVWLGLAQEDWQTYKLFGARKRVLAVTAANELLARLRRSQPAPETGLSSIRMMPVVHQAEGEVYKLFPTAAFSYQGPGGNRSYLLEVVRGTETEYLMRKARLYREYLQRLESTEGTAPELLIMVESYQAAVHVSRVLGDEVPNLPYWFVTDYHLMGARPLDDPYFLFRLSASSEFLAHGVAFAKGEVPAEPAAQPPRPGGRVSLQHGYLQTDGDRLHVLSGESRYLVHRTSILDADLAACAGRLLPGERAPICFRPGPEGGSTALDLSLVHPAVLFRQATRHAELGRYLQARKVAQRVLELAPDYPGAAEALRRWSRTYPGLRAGTGPLAIAERIHRVERDPGRAAQFYQKAIDQQDRPGEALIEYVSLLRSQGRFLEAARLLETHRSLARNPMVAEVELAELYEHAGAYAEAAQRLYQPLGQIHDRPRLRWAIRTLARLWTLLGYHADALDDLAENLGADDSPATMDSILTALKDLVADQGLPSGVPVRPPGVAPKPKWEEVPKPMPQSDRQTQPPGRSPDFRADLLLASEKDVVTGALQKVWYLLSAQRSEHKGRWYSYLIAAPTGRLVEEFHLQRPVLIAFDSAYREQDKRPGEFFEFVKKKAEELKERVDRNWVMVISPDPNIRQAARESMKGDVSSGFILAFSLEEIQSATEDVQVEALLDCSAAQNLFYIDQPLQSDTFLFGRAAIIDDYYKNYYRKGANAGLFGLRRTGKTSVLYALRRRLEFEGEPFYLIGGENQDLVFKRWNEILGMIVSQVAQFLKERAPVVHAEDEYRTNLTSANSMFVQDMKAIFEAYGRKRILLMFDEMEQFCRSLQAHDGGNDYLRFWRTVRYTQQSHPELLSVIVAGVNPRWIEEYAVAVNGVREDNPLYQFANPDNYLPMLRYGDVQELVKVGAYMGLLFDEETTRQMFQDFGGHPFLLRCACDQIHKELAMRRVRRPLRITRQLYAEDLQKRLSLERPLSQMVEPIRAWYPDEYGMLQRIAAGEPAAVKDPSLIVHLKGYGLIKQENGKYEVTVQTVRDWVVSGDAEDSRADTPPGQGDQHFLDEFRAFEDHLRDLVCSVLECHHPSPKQAILEAIVNQKDREAAASLRLRKALDKASFGDLIRLIRQNFQAMRNEYGNRAFGPDFFDHLEFIRKARNKASHEGPLPEDIPAARARIREIAKRLPQPN